MIEVVMLTGLICFLVFTFTFMVFVVKQASHVDRLIEEYHAQLDKKDGL